MRNDLSRPGKGPGPDRRAEAERFAETASNQLENAINSGEAYRIDELLSRVAVYFPSDEVRQQLDALRAAIKKDREAKQSAQIAEMNGVLKQASDAVRNAKNPEELDETLKNLSRYRNMGGFERLSEDGRMVLNKLHSLTQFIRRWQDYLAARKSDNRDRCRDILQGLTNSDEGAEIMPRSQLLAEMDKYMPPPTPRPEYSRGPEATADPPSPEQVAAIVGRAKSLDGIADVIQELQGIQAKVRPSSFGPSNVLGRTLDQLYAMQKAYREFQAGMPTKIENANNYSPDVASPAVIPLRAQLLLLMLLRFLGVSGDSFCKLPKVWTRICCA